MTTPIQQSTQSAVATRPVDILKATLNAPSVQQQFKNALGEHKDLFVASLIDLYTGDKTLQTCKPQDVVMQALKAATLDLPINKALGFAYIVVYNNNTKVVDPQTGRETWVKVPTPTFIPGYRGYIQLAARSGEYRTINADVVYEGELVKTNKLTGVIDLSGTRTSDKVVGYFAYIEYLNGFSKTIYSSVEEMAKYAKRFSPSIGYKTTVEQLIALANTPTQGKKVGWEGNFNDMAKKTMLRQLIGKYGIMSIKMQTALAADEKLDASQERNRAVADEANSKEVDVTEAAYEEVVDTETGEVVKEQPAQEGAVENIPDEPEY